MSLTITKLSPSLGVEIAGIDLAKPLGGNMMAEIRQAWLDANGIALFRDQTLNTAQHIDFSRHFGPLFGAPGEDPLQDTVSRYIHPDHPEIYRVSNKVENGEPLGRERAGTYWHSDVSFRERPASASILHAREVPKVGGDTLFADLTQAYEALSETLKDVLAPLRAHHDWAAAAAAQYPQDVVIADDLEGGNRTVHPVVRTHGDTGRKGLYVNPGFVSHLDGFERAESDAVLGYLYNHATKPEFLYRHRWRQGDLVMWDNRSLMHYAIADYGDAPRYMERTTVIGEKPV